MPITPDFSGQAKPPFLVSAFISAHTKYSLSGSVTLIHCYECSSVAGFPFPFWQTSERFSPPTTSALLDGSLGFSHLLSILSCRKPVYSPRNREPCIGSRTNRLVCWCVVNHPSETTLGTGAAEQIGAHTRLSRNSAVARFWIRAFVIRVCPATALTVFQRVARHGSFIAPE